MRCTIDGMELEVPKGTRIIDAAARAGIDVPHYCYHPGLSARPSAACAWWRWRRRPSCSPACTATVADGNVIHTQSEKALKARKGVLEFYLVNHPLDCPVCDQSGECKLQDYTAAEGRAMGRLMEPKRVQGRDDFGGDVLFNADRCVMCTRCVRFMREVAQDERLAVVQRGHKNVIDTFFDEGLDGNIWADNIVDLCPVGALVSKDFLHKARAWDLDRAPSICPNCTQGCNIRLETRDNEVMRMKPRPNPEVNAHWMCDFGRLNYEWINREGRIEAPLVRDGDRLVGVLVVGRADPPGRRPARGAGARRPRGGVAVHGQRGLGALRRVMDVVGGGTRGLPLRGRRGGGASRLPHAGAAHGPRGQRARGGALRLHARRDQRDGRIGRAPRAFAECSSSWATSWPTPRRASAQCASLYVYVGHFAQPGGAQCALHPARDDVRGDGRDLHQRAASRAALLAGDAGAGDGASRLADPRRAARRGVRRMWAPPPTLSKRSPRSCRVRRVQLHGSRAERRGAAVVRRRG